VSDVSASVRRFLQSLCSVDQLSDDDELFAGGFVNSLYLVQLLTFVHFRSLGAIAAFVDRKRGGS